MEITLRIPDQVYQEDPSFQRFFEAMQAMVDRMAMSHFKYGLMEHDFKTNVDDLRCALQRVAMYDARYLAENIWEYATQKPVNTGNTENLLDAANFLLIEYLFPRHEEAHFRAQSDTESPGLEFIG